MIHFPPHPDFLYCPDIRYVRMYKWITYKWEQWGYQYYLWYINHGGTSDLNPADSEQNTVDATQEARANADLLPMDVRDGIVLDKQSYSGPEYPIFAEGQADTSTEFGRKSIAYARTNACIAVQMCTILTMQMFEDLNHFHNRGRPTIRRRSNT